MTAAVEVVAASAGLVAAATHAFMFVRESVLFGRPATLRMLEVPAGAADAVRLWAYHQGVYNLLLGGTAAAGSVAVLLGATTVGGTLLVAATAAMVVAALALLAADRRRARLPGFLSQSAPALVALLALAARAR